MIWRCSGRRAKYVVCFYSLAPLWIYPLVVRLHEPRVHVVISAFCALAYTAFACASAPPDAMTNDGAAS